MDLKNLGPSYLEVDLDRLGYNMKNIRAYVDKDVKILAVVKGNAYGHGAVESSQVFTENGADMLGVANLVEAIELRESNIEAPILILGYTQDSELYKAVDYGVIPTIYSLDQAKILSEAGISRKKVCKIHIKIDTGMSRLGFPVNKESLKEIEEIASLLGVEIQGIFSHFIQSDIKDKSISKKQFNLFNKMVEAIKSRGIEIPLRHISNSGSLIDMPENNLDMVRVGQLLYGIYPSDQVEKSRLDIRFASALRSQISTTRKIKKGAYVGYDKGFIAGKDMEVGVIPIGYGDGYSQDLVDLVKPSIKGKKLKVIGNICMDQSLVDITGFKDVKRGDPVDLYSYEDGNMRAQIIVRLGRRLPRVYIAKGKIVKVIDYLLEDKYQIVSYENL